MRRLRSIGRLVARKLSQPWVSHSNLDLGAFFASPIYCHPFADDSIDYPVVAVSKGGSAMGSRLTGAEKTNSLQPIFPPTVFIFVSR